ncbi:MAG TPA: hypothetical protein VJA21_33020 [Verrucomicrobiae bacterium]
MNTKISTALVLAALSLAINTTSHADTIYVDQRYGPGGNGTPSAPYDTIQAGIDHTNSVMIIVYPGTYTERLFINKSLTIVGYDGPYTTRIDASAGGDAVVLARGLAVNLQGLTISSGNRGLVQPTEGTLHVRNCIFCGNQSHGVYVERKEVANSPAVYIDNCICVANGGSGLFVTVVYTSGYYRYVNTPNLRAYNNIFIGNQQFGVSSDYNGSADRVGEGASLDYNDYVANVSGNYSSLFGSGNLISAGPNSFSIAPDFVGGTACNSDFRLVPSSVCRNAGQPGLGWLNPDGTRNDIGAYGGPGAATFYTNPNDGPVIRNVTIDQGMVPRGSTFTIRAKGAVR